MFVGKVNTEMLKLSGDILKRNLYGFKLSCDPGYEYYSFGINGARNIWYKDSLLLRDVKKIGGKYNTENVGKIGFICNVGKSDGNGNVDKYYIRSNEFGGIFGVDEGKYELNVSDLEKDMIMFEKLIGYDGVEINGKLIREKLLEMNYLKKKEIIDGKDIMRFGVLLIWGYALIEIGVEMVSDREE